MPGRPVASVAKYEQALSIHGADSDCAAAPWQLVRAGGVSREARPIEVRWLAPENSRQGSQKTLRLRSDKYREGATELLHSGRLHVRSRRFCLEPVMNKFVFEKQP